MKECRTEAAIGISLRKSFNNRPLECSKENAPRISHTRGRGHNYAAFLQMNYFAALTTPE
jgi:hypothetical protein